ncbi:MAG: segregation/condensation protein A [Phycisphaerae bacterium]|nr:segregation/condensation protein A [Phycisphaerae bacterium]
MTEKYRVQLDIYNGPLDLLLYLIRRDEIDITDIPIVSITHQYVKYIEVIKEINLELAGDFIVMAATLMEIKSAMLIPRDEVSEGEEGEDLSDPRLELVKQLLEYKKYKDASTVLDDSAVEQAMRYHRPLADLKRVKKELKSEQELDMESVQIWDLMDAFQRLMKGILANTGHEVIHDYTPIDVYEVHVLDMAQQKKSLRFEDVFATVKTRMECMGLFLSLLELMRQKLVRIEQEKTFGHIYVFPLTDEPAELAVARTVSGQRQEEDGYEDNVHQPQNDIAQIDNQPESKADIDEFLEDEMGVEQVPEPLTPDEPDADEEYTDKVNFKDGIDRILEEELEKDATSQEPATDDNQSEENKNS